MLRTTLDKAYLKRSIRPRYAFTQATPKGLYLDPAWDRSVDIYPGMGMTRSGGEKVTLVGAAANTGLGLIANFVGGYGIDEPAESGVNAVAVWFLGPDSEFEVDAPAFNSALTWTDPTDGTSVLVHVQTTGATRGQLVPAGTSGATTNPVGRLIEVLSTTTIVVGGLVGTTA